MEGVSLLQLLFTNSVLIMVSSIKPLALILHNKMAQLKGNIGILQSVLSQCFPIHLYLYLIGLMQCPQPHTLSIDFPHLYSITNLHGKSCFSLNLIYFILDPLVALVFHCLYPTTNTSFNLIPNLAYFLVTLTIQRVTSVLNLALIGFIFLDMSFSMKLSFSHPHPLQTLLLIQLYPSILVPFLIGQLFSPIYLQVLLLLSILCPLPLHLSQFLPPHPYPLPISLTNPHHLYLHLCLTLHLFHQSSLFILLPILMSLFLL